VSEPKLYRVRIEADVYVVAASEHDAEEYALRERDVVDDAMDNALAVASLVTVKGLNRNEEMSLPWVDDDLDGDVDRDRTVRDWAAMNDAAVERALREREFNARQLTLSGT
jgi:hypothetical protein